MTPRHHAALPLPYGPMDAKGAALLSRTSADIPAKDKNLIKSICPKSGILNQIVQNVFFSITNNLRKNGITYYSPDHEQYLVDLLLRGCTAIESSEPTFVGNVYRGIEGTCAGATGSVIESSNTEEENLRRETDRKEVVNQTGGRCEKDAE